ILELGMIEDYSDLSVIGYESGCFGSLSDLPAIGYESGCFGSLSDLPAIGYESGCFGSLSDLPAIGYESGCFGSLSGLPAIGYDSAIGYPGRGKAFTVERTTNKRITENFMIIVIKNFLISVYVFCIDDLLHQSKKNTPFL
ncbi:5287_t:CDS:1, partial [Gigaspora margarita]